MSLTEEEIDDFLYYSRVGDLDEFKRLEKEICMREKLKISELVQLATDERTGNGVLHMAAANGHCDFIKMICESTLSSSPKNTTKSSLLNAQNLAGNTALHWAALNGHLDVIQVLLKQGADPSIINGVGHDAVYEAEVNDNNEIVEWFLRNGGENLDQAIGGKNESEERIYESHQNAGLEKDHLNINSGLEQISINADQTSH